MVLTKQSKKTDAFCCKICQNEQEVLISLMLFGICMCSDATVDVHWRICGVLVFVCIM